MGAASSILASYADVMRGGGNIFCTQKIFTNNSNFRTSITTSAPALSTTSPTKQDAPNQSTEIKKNENDDNEENDGEDNEIMENEEKEDKLAA